MICSELSGIEIIDATVSSEDGVLTVSWQVYNDRDEPIYLLNINEPLIKKMQVNLLVFLKKFEPWDWDTIFRETLPRTR